MGNDYYGRNDYRDYLAHYGVKGMKWKKRKRRSLTSEEIRAIRRNRLRQQMARDMDADARNRARAERLNKKARSSSGGASGGKGAKGGTIEDIYRRNRMLATTSGLRVEANRGQYEPISASDVKPASKNGSAKKPVKLGKKKAKAKLAKMLGSTIKTVKGKARSKSVFDAMSKMRGTAR